MKLVCCKPKNQTSTVLGVAHKEEVDNKNNKQALNKISPKN